jgi:hypothetical protein
VDTALVEFLLELSQEVKVVGVKAAGVKVDGDLELASGVAADTTVAKVTTGPQVSRLQATIRCFKIKVSHIRWG